MSYLKNLNFTMNNYYNVKKNDNEPIVSNYSSNLKQNLLTINSEKKKVKKPSLFRHSMFIGIKGSGSGCGSCG